MQPRRDLIDKTLSVGCWSEHAGDSSQRMEAGVERVRESYWACGALAVLAIVGFQSVARGASRLIWQVSLDGGTTWQSGTGIKAYTNTTLKVRAIVDWTGTTAYGFAGLAQKIYIDNYDSTDGGALVATNGVGYRVPPYDYGPSPTLAVRSTGFTQRICAVNSGGVELNIAMGQLSPGSPTYSRANPAPFFRFDYAIGPVPNRTIVIMSDVALDDGIPSAFFYHPSLTSGPTKFGETGVVVRAKVDVLPNPGCQVLSEPGDQKLVPGATASFTFGFSDPAATYQWRKDGEPMTDDSRISGSKSPSLVIRGVGAGDAGGYDCVVSGACNSTSSRIAALECTASPNEQPKGGTFAAGNLVVLNGQSSQTEGVTYQWHKDGTPVSESSVFSGAKAPILMIASINPTQSGAYTVAVTNACGTTISEPANVTIYCAADFNADLSIDFSDFDAFVAAFEHGEPRSDINGDTFLDFEDFDAFVQAFERSC